MVNFKRFILDNGLRVIVHEDHATPMAVLNILYDVGARDEDPSRTGFAHLFEHLMFGGSEHIPQFDAPLQRVGGENNAFTNNDITNYYTTVPSANLETAFWLESDRMLNLAFSEKSLDTQKSVVIEEFKQRYLNQPYGDMWLRIRALTYKLHPYKWAAIGKKILHIEQAQISDVKQFFKEFYAPSRAILCVAGDVWPDEIKGLAEKWFNEIPSVPMKERVMPNEPPQTEARREVVKTDVPVNAIYIAFHMGGRNDADYYATDLLSDVLSGGTSSRLFRKLVKERALFTELKAYITGNIDPGLFVIEGKPIRDISLEMAEEAIWHELELLKNEPVMELELIKVKNKLESATAFSKMNILDKALNLSYFELLGDPNMINEEINHYLKVEADEIQRVSQTIFRKINSNTLIYIACNDR